MWQMLIPAAASLIGGLIGGKASKKAAKQQIAGQREAIRQVGYQMAASNPSSPAKARRVSAGPRRRPSSFRRWRCWDWISC